MTLTVTGAQLRAIAGAKAPRTDELAGAYNDGAPRFALDVEVRAEHFWSQWAHESGGFKYLREIWGPTAAQARYEGRRDLGNTQPGDGKRFMGHGLPQVTGRANHREFTAWAKARYPDAPDFEADPETLAQYPWALIAAFWYWDTRNLNTLADRDDLLGITKRINGGTNGLADRRLKLALAKKAITAGIVVPLAPVAGNDNFGRKTLRRRSAGEDVRMLQRMLNATGGHGITFQVDGRFGPKTEAAVLDFQRERGLSPDGIVGPATWAAFDGLKVAA